MFKVFKIYDYNLLRKYDRVVLQIEQVSVYARLLASRPNG